MIGVFGACAVKPIVVAITIVVFVVSPVVVRSGEKERERERGWTAECRGGRMDGRGVSVVLP